MANGKQKQVAPKQSFSIASVAEDLGEKGFENMGAKDSNPPTNSEHINFFILFSYVYWFS